MAKKNTVEVRIAVKNATKAGVTAVNAGFRSVDKAIGAVKKSVFSLQSAFASLAVGAAMKSVISTFAGFDDQVRKLGAIAGSSKKELALFTEEALRLGKETKFSGTKAAEGMTMLAQAGLSATEILEVIPGVLDLAAAGGLELADASVVATDTLAQMGLQLKDIAEVNDVLVGAANNSKASVAQLTEAMKTAGPAGSQMNMTLVEIISVLGGMAEAGFRGGEAGNAFKRMLVALIEPSNKARFALGQLGVETRDVVTKEFRGLIPILKDLGKANMDTGQAVKIFGLYSGAVAAATAKQAAKTGELTQKLLDVKNVARQVSADMEGGLGGALRRLEAVWESLQIAIGKAFGKQLNADIETLQKKIAGLIERIDGLAADGTLGKLYDRMKKVVELTIEWGPALIKLMIVAKIAGAVNALATSVGLLSGAMGVGGATGAVSGFGLALGTIVVSLGAVGVAALALATGGLAAIVWSMKEAQDASIMLESKLDGLMGRLDVMKAKFEAFEDFRLPTGWADEGIAAMQSFNEMLRKARASLVAKIQTLEVAKIKMKEAGAEGSRAWQEAEISIQGYNSSIKEVNNQLTLVQNKLKETGKASKESADLIKMASKASKERWADMTKSIEENNARIAKSIQDAAKETLKTYEKGAEARKLDMERQLLMVEKRVAQELLTEQEGVEKKLQIEKEYNEAVLESRKTQLKAYEEAWKEEITKYQEKADKMSEIERKRVEEAIKNIRKLKNEVTASENELLKASVEKTKQVASAAEKAASELKKAGDAGKQMGSDIVSGAKAAADSVNEITRTVTNMTSQLAGTKMEIPFKFESDGVPLSEKFKRIWKSIKGLNENAMVTIISEINASKQLKSMYTIWKRYATLAREASDSYMRHTMSVMAADYWGQINQFIEQIALKTKASEASLAAQAALSKQDMVGITQELEEAVKKLSPYMTQPLNVSRMPSYTPGGTQGWQMATPALTGQQGAKTQNQTTFNFKGSDGATVGPFSGDAGLGQQLADLLRREGMVMA